MMQVEDKYLREVLELFHKTAIEVCEGQQLDMNFESRNDVSIPEYINMIALKPLFCSVLHCTSELCYPELCWECQIAL